MANFRIYTTTPSGEVANFVGYENGEYTGSPALLTDGFDGVRFRYFDGGASFSMPAMESPWHWFHFGKSILGDSAIVEGDEPPMSAEAQAYFDEVDASYEEGAVY